MRTCAEGHSSESARLRYRIAWVPALLVGFSAAIAAELAAGLLLYSSEGLLRALTTVLATETASLGAGFLLSRGMDEWKLEGTRRRWLFAILSFGAAAIFAGAWGLTGGVAVSPLYQGVGLALLAALPLFSAGAVLAALDVHGDSAVAAPASFGATVGLLLAGFYGVAAVQPASLLLLCVVLLSAAALHHGWIVDGRIRVRRGERGVEEWARSRPAFRMEVLRVGAALADARLSSPPIGPVVIPWQRQVLEAVKAEWPSSPDRILLAGVGLGALQEALQDIVFGESLVSVTWSPENAEPPELSSGGWEGRFRGVIVNSRLLPRRGPLGGPDMDLLDRIVRCWNAQGPLFLGGVGPSLAATTEWLAERTSMEPLHFRPESGSGGGGTGAEGPRSSDPALLLDDTGGLLVCRPGASVR